ncbi:TIR domain-containing protein [bacterium]|nr:TIR domain-containing protein [bacterium]
MPNDFKYDVFLSHSAKDKPVMRVLANRLKEDKLRVWFGESDSLSPQGEGRG